MKQFTEEEAIAYGRSEAWKALSDRERACFGMAQTLLCMPFSELHGAVERTLGRPVYTHEFGSAGRGRIIAELLGEAGPASIEEIIALIPPEKLIVATTRTGKNRADG